jgi:hypothetical protein
MGRKYQTETMSIPSRPGRYWCHFGSLIYPHLIPDGILSVPLPTAEPLKTRIIWLKNHLPFFSYSSLKQIYLHLQKKKMEPEHEMPVTVFFPCERTRMQYQSTDSKYLQVDYPEVLEQ